MTCKRAWQWYVAAVVSVRYSKINKRTRNAFLDCLEGVTRNSLLHIQIFKELQGRSLELFEGTLFHKANPPTIPLPPLEKNKKQKQLTTSTARPPPLFGPVLIALMVGCSLQYAFCRISVIGYMISNITGSLIRLTNWSQWNTRTNSARWTEKQ